MKKFDIFLSHFLTKEQQKVFLFLLLFFAFGKGLDLVSYQKYATPEEKKRLTQALEKQAKVVFDLQTATAQELEMVPGIGAKTAAKIIALRPKFTCREDLLKVKGIGPAKFAKIKDYFLPFGQTHQEEVAQEKKSQAEFDLQAESVDLNTAGVQELTSVKGIGKVTAQKIVEYREKNGRFDSLEDLLKIKGIGKKKLQLISKQAVIR